MFDSFSLNLDTGNDAFSDMPGDEVARILRAVADDVKSGQWSGVLLDCNGNRVGGYEFS